MVGGVGGQLQKEGIYPHCCMGFPGGLDGKESACSEKTQVRSLGQEDPLEKEMATHSSILAWRIPWTEETGGLQTVVVHQKLTQHCKAIILQLKRNMV